MMFFRLNVIPRTKIGFYVARRRLKGLKVIATTNMTFRNINMIFLRLVMRPTPTSRHFSLFLNVLPFRLPGRGDPRAQPRIRTLTIIMARRDDMSGGPIRPFTNVKVATSRPHRFRIGAFGKNRLRRGTPRQRVGTPMSNNLGMRRRLIRRPHRRLQHPQLIQKRTPHHSNRARQVTRKFFRGSVGLTVYCIYSQGLGRSPRVTHIGGRIINLRRHRRPHMLGHHRTTKQRPTQRRRGATLQA